MKRKDLIKKITEAGCVGKKQPIPRHDEIDVHLARHIIKILT
jgi:hypothetical protein